MRRLKILAIEPDEEVKVLYSSYLSARSHLVQTMSSISYELDASDYDVVIVHSEEIKQHIVGIPFDKLIVAGNHPSAHYDGNWAITKPFHMEELSEVLEIIADPTASINKISADRILQ